MSADKLASFRVDSDLWQQFQSHAKENNTNASALLVAYIKSVVNTGNVITSNPVVNTSIDVNNPSLLIQDIDKRIDEKIKQSIQNINTLSIQDIDNCIDDSLVDGKIKEAIANSYAGMMAQFNGLLEEWQELQKQVEELQSIPPVPQLPTAEGLATDNEELTIDNEQLTTPGETDDGQFTEDVESDRTDSDLTSDTQSTITNQQSPLWDNKIMKNPVDSIRKQLKKKDITKTAEEIKQAFLNAGFDGSNHQSLREEVIKTLSQE